MSKPYSSRPSAPRSAKPKPAPPKTTDERKIYGINACQSFYKRFPERIIRAWLSEDAAKIHFGPLMKHLAGAKRAYHLANEAELEKVTDSSHHEGVCLLIEELPVFSPEAFVATLPAGKPVCVIALDGVSNPHNIGAIMRVAAHFDVVGIITEEPLVLRSGSAMRTAEGGATSLMVVGTDNLVRALNYMKKCKFTIAATSSHESQSVYGEALPEKLVLVLGEEQDGVSGRVLQVANLRLGIAGTGAVESLNVSVATGILLSEFWRTYRVYKPIDIELERPVEKALPVREEQSRSREKQAPQDARHAAGAKKPAGFKARSGGPRPGPRKADSARSGAPNAAGKVSGKATGRTSAKPSGKSGKRLSKSPPRKGS